MNIIQWVISLFAKKDESHPPELLDYDDVDDWAADYNDWLKEQVRSTYGELPLNKSRKKR